MIRLIKFIIVFIEFLGSQNDYLYPTDENDKSYTPFKKKHWYKTRFGFITSWNLAKVIIY